MFDISLDILTGVVFWLTTTRITTILAQKKRLNKLLCVTLHQGICDERDILTCMKPQL
jgi:hypothetical protein